MQKKRFYDQDPLVSQAIHLLLLLPGEIQTLVAECTARIAESEYRANELMHNTKSLGSDKILALYKSKQKKREYDQNPLIHRALTYLMLLSEENRRLIASRIVGLISQINDYLRSCQASAMAPSIEHMRDIRSTYLKLGPEEASRKVKHIQEQTFRLGRRVRPAPSGIPAKAESIIEKKLGLRVRADWPPAVKPQES